MKNVTKSVTLCEFCKQHEVEIEIELFNITSYETGHLWSCSKCALNVFHVHIQPDREGMIYGDMGCIGGSPEESN